MSSLKPSVTTPTYIFKVPVAGDGAVGKTSLIIRYTQGTFTDTYKMTIGTSFAVRQLNLGNVLIKLQIWDLAGQPHFGTVRPLFYQGSTGVIYVFSMTDRKSFEHLDGWLEEVGKHAGEIPGILIGNKSDLTKQRVVTSDEAKAYANRLGLTYMETSAKLDLNVGDAFETVAKEIIKTKWPEWLPAEPEIEEPVSTPVPSEVPPVEASADEALEPVLAGTTEAISIPSEERQTPPEPNEAPTLKDQVAPITEPSPEMDLEPEPQEVPEIIENTNVTEPVEPMVSSPQQEYTLIEFAGEDTNKLSQEDFEQRVVQTLRRLGVNESGVLGTFLLGLAQKEERDVVLESLKKLQEG